MHVKLNYKFVFFATNKHSYPQPVFTEIKSCGQWRGKRKNNGDGEMEHGNQIVGRVVSRLLKRKSTILFLRGILNFHFPCHVC